MFVYRDQYGRPQLYVRNEEREGELEHLFVRVVNRNTHEVVSQVPAEYLLRLADDLKPH